MTEPIPEAGRSPLLGTASGGTELAGTSSFHAEEGPTLPAPTFAAALTKPRHSGSVLPASLPRLGETLGDFHLLKVLGEGSFGRVFLARQLSLDRLVALKVSIDCGNEARTLASLEHNHIVGVFLETTDPARCLRVLCLQYVAGATLEHVMKELARRDPAQWNGRAVLEVLDATNPHPAAFDPTALRERERLDEAGWAETVCRIGARLAEALAYAHSRGVLHRDIKPANILINQYGRPLLADFNIALDERHDGANMFGGTLGYMAPEHIDAINPQDATGPEAVDARSDIYSLGVVLYELLSGQRPFRDPTDYGDVGPTLRDLADRRRAGPLPMPEKGPKVQETLVRVIRRCLAPRPEDRWQNGTELAQALDGCCELEEVCDDLPVPGAITRAAVRHPFLGLMVLTLLPHLIGSLVNIGYNYVRVIRHLDGEQHEAFDQLVIGYNLVVYPLALAVLWWRVAPALRTWRAIRTGDVDVATVSATRQRLLTLPWWVLALSCAGWFPGGLIFPLVIRAMGGPLPDEVFEHFVFSFTLSGLIALTYSALGVEFGVLRVLYPRFWVDTRGVRSRMAEELRSFGPRPQVLQWLAGGIPLSAAVLMALGGPGIAGSHSFRVLVTALILLGMAGFGLALLAGNQLAGTLAVLRGWPQRGSRLKRVA